MKSFYKILVVDDEEAMREVCYEVLTAEGYHVAVACDGWEALGLIDAGWDMILTDYTMPGLNGVEFFKAAERRVPGIENRFFFMTGDRTSAEIVEGMNLKLIRKPFRVKDLLENVAGILRDSELHRKDKRVQLAGCPLHICFHGMEIDAVAENLSLNGMKIRYAGTPIEAGPGLKISIEGLNIRMDARVVWSSASADSVSHSGIIFEQPVSMSVISELMPSKCLS